MKNVVETLDIEDQEQTYTGVKENTSDFIVKGLYVAARSDC